VLTPERECGERFANLLLHEGVRGELPLGGDMVLTELDVPSSFVGRSLVDLDLRRRFEVTVVAVRQRGSTQVDSPQAQEAFREGDMLVLVAKPETVSKMLQKLE
ncbi:MAG: TrkA C-terminal domain-containing protein, partial [Myxococcota bacterium]